MLIAVTIKCNITAHRAEQGRASEQENFHWYMNEINVAKMSCEIPSQME